MRASLIVASALVVSIAGSNAGCANENFTSADAGSVDAAPTADATTIDSATTLDGGAPDSAGACPGTAGPTPVRVDPRFCIDSTEVTNRQYADFIAVNGGPAVQPDVCLWNTSFIPPVDPICPGANVFDPVNHPNDPVACVDWCDARAYCEWAGKRLCGRIGGGALTLAEGTDPGVSEYMFACTANGTRNYPYGNSYMQQACNTKDRNPGGNTPSALPVGSLAACTGGFPGLFDLAGNVSEWENACDGVDGKNDLCAEGGDSSTFNTSDTRPARCDNGHDSDMRSKTGIGVGFRCCSP